MRNYNLCLAVIFFILTYCSSETSLTWQEQAEQYFNNNEYSEAAEFLKEQLFTDPDNQELYYYLGQTYKMLACDDGSKLK